MISFERVRKLCHSLDGVEEKLSHGEPTFFVGKRVFVMYSANHHGDLRYALWCNAAEGAQEILVKSDPQNFFVVKDAYAVTRAKAQRKSSRRSRLL